MFLFDLLFGGKHAAAPPAPQTPAAPAPVPVTAPAAVSVEERAPGTRIRFDPQLIAQLKDDHQLLLQVFSAMDAALRGGDLLEVEKRLGQFRTLLMDHLLKENVRLYIYLEHLLQHDDFSHQLVHEFRHEMDGIGRVVVEFLGKYKALSRQPTLVPAFALELASIGKALVARIQREEQTLYPMYSAPAEYL